MKLDVAAERFGLARAFAISRGSKTEARVVTVCVEGGWRARIRRMRPISPATARRSESVIAGIEALPRPLDRARLQEPAPGRRRPQCRGLRALGPGGQNGRPEGVGACRAARTRSGGHRLHAIAGRAAGNGGRRRPQRPSPAAQDQAWGRGRSGAAGGGQVRRPRGADHCRRQRGLGRRDLRRPHAGSSCAWAWKWSNSRCRPMPTGRCTDMKQAAARLRRRKAATTGHRSARWPASTTWSTSSWTRPAA